MNSDSSNQIRGLEKVIWSLDEAPLDTLHRIAIGFTLLAAYDRMVGWDSAPWKLPVFVLLLIFALKLGFGVLRRLMPVSSELKAAWKERRVLGKNHDSYQWKKMLGFGLGMAAFLFWSGRAQGFPLAFATACTLAGCWGMIHWQGRKKALAVQVAAPAA